MTVQISDKFEYCKQEVTLLAVESFPLYDPCEHGYKPQAMSTACWRGYVCEYEVARGRLLLKNLRVNDEDKGYLNERIYFPLDYSGKILIGSNLDGMYSFTGFQESYGFEEVIELSFKEGVLVYRKDYSERAKAIRELIERDSDSFRALEKESENPLLQYLTFITKSFSISYPAKAWWLEDVRVDELIGTIEPVTTYYDPDNDPEISDPYFQPERPGFTIVSNIKKDSLVCGHCKWAKRNYSGKGWQCENWKVPYQYRQVEYAYEACNKFEKYEYVKSAPAPLTQIQDEKKTEDDVGKRENDQSNSIDVAIGVAEEETLPVRNLSVAEDVEQIGKDIVIGRKQVEYRDDRNIISVIINAISIRINMPRGTVKALMTYLAVLLLAVVVFIFNGPGSRDTTDSGTDTADTETSRDYPVNEEGRALNTERAASAVDYVIISPHYRYSVPVDVLEVWEPDDYYYENETFSDYKYCDNVYTIRSYLLDYSDNELSYIVKNDLLQFDNMKFLEEQYIESRYGDILMIRFEATDEDGYYTAATGYYWYDSDPKICCLEISSDDWHDNGAEEEVLDSVYRISTDNNEAPSDAEEIWQKQQQEDAMNSLVEDAMQDYYEPGPDTDPMFD